MPMHFLEAIARQEGFYIPHSRADRNNNPGNIEYGTFAINYGATRVETVGPQTRARFAYFPSASQGFLAMKGLFFEHYQGMNVEQALNKYAPPIENETNIYINNVCTWAQCTKSDLVSTLLGV